MRLINLVIWLNVALSPTFIFGVTNYASTYESNSYYLVGSLTREQYFRLAQEHRSAIRFGMNVAYEEFKSDFPQLTAELVDSYARLHDLPKTQSLEELRAWGYTLDVDIATYLGQFYGVDIEEMSLSDRLLFETVKLQLNEIEARQKAVFFEEYFGGASVEEVIKALALLERIVDVVTRAIIGN